MCAPYEVPGSDRYTEFFKAPFPKGLFRSDIWPGYESAFIRRPQEANAGDEAVPNREAVRGIFGLVPHWSKDLKSAKRTYNARSETVAEKPSFRDAWRAGQHCIIAAATIYEPDWRSAKAISTRISHADGEPLGIAGLWASWRSPTGDTIHSFTMLTINADHHDLMKNYHRPTDEKRMVVIVPRSAYDDWLKATPGASMQYMQPFPAEHLTASAAE